MNTYCSRLTGLLASIVMLTLLCGCQSQAEIDKAKWPTWFADAASASELGEEVDVLGIKIRPPKDFQFQAPVDGPNDSKIASWIQRRDAFSVRAVQLMVAPIPSEIRKPTPANALNLLFENPGQRRNGQEPISMGIVNDIEFARTSWIKGAAGRSNGDEGFFYVAIIGDKLYQLSTHDSNNAPDGDLEVCHASILSFKK